ncbi:MAG: hypothetical protein HC844_08230 [Tabrizicola sp.]|nr:hypothetical protein [Tabrizicola sp.]
MKRFAGTIGIQQGSRVLFSDYADDGVMWTGKGPRESRHRQDFDDPFVAPPVVMVSISMWDIDHKTNSRADITAENVGPSGFDIVFRTWSDSHVARIRADWTAIGQIRDDETWEVG